MNKIVMVVWGLAVFGILTLIFMIGYKEQDRDYINLSKELETASKIYIKDNRLSASLGSSVIVYIDDLINGQYIEENDKIKEYCIEGIVYTNHLIKDSYTLRLNCEDKETEE